jgi:hypothetical protein
VIPGEGLGVRVYVNPDLIRDAIGKGVTGTGLRTP